MRLEIVQVPNCPNVGLLEQRLDEVLAGHPGPVQRVHRIVEDPDTAAAAGMTGSPTLLVDGLNPFAESGASTSVSCRLYRDEDGRPQGAPTVTALRQALGLPAADRHRVRPDTVGGAEDCCATGADGSAGARLSGWRARTAPADPAGRALHRVILRAFAATGAPPHADELDRERPGSGWRLGTC
ncbi:MAG: hypothetical protein ABR528_06715 [Pseudonocardiaceae bacterium]